MELSHLDRNLDGLVQELAARCQQVFSTASHAAARSAVISVDGGALPPQAAEASAATVCLCVRQRVIYEGNEVNSKFFFFSSLKRSISHWFSHRTARWPLAISRNPFKLGRKAAP